MVSLARNDPLEHFLLYGRLNQIEKQARKEANDHCAGKQQDSACFFWNRDGFIRTGGSFDRRGGIEGFKQCTEREAAANKHTYLDYFAAMTDDKGLLRTELSTDDLHPNAEGYKIMAPLAEAAIARAVR